MSPWQICCKRKKVVVADCFGSQGADPARHIPATVNPAAATCHQYRCAFFARIPAAEIFMPVRHLSRRRGRIMDADYLSSHGPKNWVAHLIAKMLTRVKERFATSDLLAFNLQNRDRWVAAQAALEPVGSRVLDVGAGSAPYRVLFSRCDSQEAVRFVHMTRPFALGMPIFAEIAWLPFWCALTPLLALVIPLIAKLLDPFDQE